MGRYLLDHQTLFEIGLADLPEEDRITVGSGGAMRETGEVWTGVVVPFEITAGQILDPERARQIGAQLLLAADLHDDIANSAIARHEQATMRVGNPGPPRGKS